MRDTFLIEMINGSLTNLSLLDIMLLSKCQYCYDTDFQSFVTMNRKTLRTSIRCFTNRFHYVFQQSLTLKSKTHMRRNKMKIRVHTPVSKFLFYLLYLKYGTTTITLEHIYKYLRQICDQSDDSSFDSDDEIDKSIYLLLFRGKSFVIKCDNTMHTTPEEHKTNDTSTDPQQNTTDKRIFRVFHEAHIYHTVHSLMPADSVQCVCYGKIDYKNAQAVHNDLHFDLRSLAINRETLHGFLDQCKYLDQEHNHHFVPFMMTVLYPGYTTLSSQWNVLTNEKKKLVLENIIQRLSPLHQNRIYHSDMHQNNILCNIEGEVKLFDFDLSSHLPHYESFILENYEFDYDMITKALSHFQTHVNKETVLLCMDYYYVIFITDLYLCTSSDELFDLLSVKSLIETHDNIYKKVRNYRNRKHLDMSEYTKRAIVSVLLFSHYFSNKKKMTV